MRWIFAFFLSLGLSSCLKSDLFPKLNLKGGQRAQQPPVESSIDSEERDWEESSDRSSSGCRNAEGSVDGPEVTLKELERINDKNAGDYEIGGKCSHSDRLVEIRVNGYKLDQNPVCNRGRWEISLDLTDVATESEDVEFQISHGSDSNIICESQKSSFSCPSNYIPIPSVFGAYEESFCVMKYEARLSQGQAVSSPEGRPVTGLTYDEALSACKSNGSHYDLISNSQWQSIARLVESEDENWKLGRAVVQEGNALNCGNTLSISSADSSSALSRWTFERRTHKLPSGHWIWDMCGNAGEMMSDLNRESFSVDGYIYEIRIRNIKSRFGPRKSYITTSESPSRRENYYWGLGYAYLTDSRNLIIRGHNINKSRSISSRSSIGIFSVDLSMSRSEVSRSGLRKVGFRCVYE